MCLLVEELCVIDQCQNVDEDAIVGLLVEVSFLGTVAFINNNIDSFEQILHKVMLADSITWLCVFH